jgi:hypothetical protein
MATLRDGAPSQGFRLRFTANCSGAQNSADGLPRGELRAAFRDRQAGASLKR